jgi:hypothetical protein
MVACWCIAWNKAHGDTWDRMLVSWSDADIDTAIAGAKVPAVRNEVEAAGSAGEVREDAGADGAVAITAEVGDEVGGEAVEDAGTNAVADADGEAIRDMDGATSSGEVEIVDKGKAKAEEAGRSDDNEDDVEGDADEDDEAATRPIKMRRAIAYDPHDPRVSKHVVILPIDTPPKYPSPRPLRMSTVKAEPVDRLSVVSLFFFS